MDKIVDGPNRKVARARSHLVELQRIVDQYMAQNPFAIVEEQIPAHRQTIYYVETRTEIPADISLIFGDLVHNLACSLDHLAFALIGASAKAPQNVYFPFAKSEAALPDTIARCQFHLTGKATRAALNAAKPYPNGQTTLHAVHTLDGRDKHRLILMIAEGTNITGEQLGVIAQRDIRGGEFVIRTGDQPFLTANLTGTRKALRALRHHKKYLDLGARFTIGLSNDCPLSHLDICGAGREMINSVEATITALAEAWMEDERG